MGEFTKPKSLKQYHENFEQIKPLMTADQSAFESAHCLFCHDAPCIQACPTRINIPLFIRQIYSGNVMGAAETIYEANTLGFACGKVCPTEMLCEGACVYNKLHLAPIQIGRLQSYATRSAIEAKRKFFSPKTSNNGKRVAIIGAGPSGIACGCELKRLGYEVEIFEAKAQPSGLALYGVAPYKINNDELLQEMAYLIAEFQLNIVYQHPVSSEELAKFDKRYAAIFLGIGLGKTSALGIPGEHLANCVGAVELIEEIRTQQHKVKIGKQVIVLGGGNTAMDAASESARLGAEEVTLAYRRSKQEMPAYGFEFDLAKKVGVKAMFQVAPVEILGNKTVAGVKFVRMKADKASGTGKPKLTPVPKSEFTVECDMVIKAIGQEQQTDFLQKIAGIKLEHGCIVTNPETLQTGNPKYFAAGDAVNGGKEVVNAVAEGKRAAKGIHQYLDISCK